MKKDILLAALSAMVLLGIFAAGLPGWAAVLVAATVPPLLRRGRL